MRLFMIRWSNGTTNVVGAPTKDEALEFVDCEWENPYDGDLQELKRFAMDIEPMLIDGKVKYMVDFGPFGGDHAYHLAPRAYPLIDEFEMKSKGDPTKGTVEEVFAAEMARLRKPPDPTEAVMVGSDALLPK